MLLEFTVRNFRSFKEMHTLSLLADTGDEHSDTHTVASADASEEHALRSAVVYGPNASGKTNLLLALDAMRDVVRRSASAGQRGDEIGPIEPFRLSPKTRRQPTLFEVVFVEDGVRYQYGFTATKERVEEEWLYAFPKNRPRLWFKRSFDAEKPEPASFETGKHFTGQQKQIWNATRKNALFLSTAAQLNNEKVAPVFDWFRKRLAYISNGRLNSTFTVDLCEDEARKHDVLNLLQRADFGIKDLHVEEQPFDFDEMPAGLMDLLDESGQKEQVGRALSRSIRFQHTEEVDDEGLLAMGEESHGIQRYFALVGPILDVVRDGRVLVIDELDDSLHPLLVKAIVNFFNSPETNPNGAQLLFNTHDTTLLDQDVFRRDQIWFTEKNRDGASELIPLLEFSPRKGTEALEKNYLRGRYGALPLTRLSTLDFSSRHVAPSEKS